MTKQNNTKRALLASIFSVFLCIAMFVGSTFAWFTDTASTGINKITSGNLDVELEYFNGTDWVTVDPTESLFKSADETLWEPGHTEYVNLRIRNAGSLALQYDFRVATYGAADGITPEKTYINKEGNPFKLSDYLIVHQLDGKKEPAAREELWLDAAIEAACIGRLDKTGAAGVLLSGEAKELTLAVYMPTSVGNEANQSTNDAAVEKANVYLGLDLMATQTPHEFDSFNNQYDALISIPEFVYTSDMAIYKGDTIAGQNDGGMIKVSGIAEADDATGKNTSITVTPKDKGASGTETYITSSVTAKQESGDADYSMSISAWNVEVKNLSQATVSIYVGRGLKDVSMHHNGVEMTAGDGYTLNTYNYNEGTGYITFTNDRFSPYDITYETPTAYVEKYQDPTSGGYTPRAEIKEEAYTYAHISELFFLGGKYKLTKDCYTNDTLTMNRFNGKYNSYGFIPIGALDIDFNGYTVTNECTYYSFYSDLGYPITLSNGTFNATCEARFVSGDIKLQNINWKIPTPGENGLNIRHNGTLTIDSDSIIESVATNGKTAIMVGTGQSSSGNPAILNMYGKVINTGMGYAISGNGSDKIGSVVNIYDGAVVKSTSSTAIYNPQKGNINVYGGLIEGVSAAIAFKCETLNIFGGTIHSTTGFASTGTPQGSGIDGMGCAIAVDANTGYATSPTINISGGTIISDHNFAIREIGNETGETVTRKLTLNITGGKLKSGVTNNVDETEMANGIIEGQQLPAVLLRSNTTYDISISDTAELSVGKAEGVQVSYCQYHNIEKKMWYYHQSRDLAGWQGIE